MEHSLAHIGQWHGDRPRYIVPRKHLFDLRRSAELHNLHVIARMPHKPAQSLLHDYSTGSLGLNPPPVVQTNVYPELACSLTGSRVYNDHFVR